MHKIDIPLRPIVSTPKALRENIEKWSANSLKLLLYHPNSYVKDSEFLKNKLLNIEVSN